MAARAGSAASRAPNATLTGGIGSARQRTALILDIVFLWLLRPPILADLSIESFGRARVFARVLRGFGLVFAGIVSIAALWFSIVIATIPGERQGKKLAALDPPLWQVSYWEFGIHKTKLGSTHELLFAGPVNTSTRRRMSPFSNTLVLPGFNIYEALKIDDPKKLAWKEHLFDFRARHLKQAVLYDADLTKTDLFGAQLQGASLVGAKLQGASLDIAELQGASLDWAQLQGAALDGAQLQGALLVEAQLQGAALYGAQLQGASLYRAQVQGASLYGAELQGALLVEAQLQGASLAYAQLQGASLVVAKIRATDFSGAFPWRTQWGQIDPERLGAVRLDTSLERWKPIWQRETFSDLVPWDAKAYADLRVSMNSIPEGKMRDEALKRIETLDCANKTLASCDPAAEPPPKVLVWQKKLLEANIDDAAFQIVLAKELGDLVCSNDTNAIYILR